LKIGRCLHRQLGRVLALEDAISVAGCAPELVENAALRKSRWVKCANWRGWPDAFGFRLVLQAGALTPSSQQVPLFGCYGRSHRRRRSLHPCEVGTSLRGVADLDQSKP